MITLGRFKTNRVYTGDNVELCYHLPPECVDLVVTSPPYDLVEWRDGELITDPSNGMRKYDGTYSWDFAKLARQLVRIIKPGGIIVWVVGDKSVDGSETGSSFVQALYFKSLGLRLHDTMIYHRTCLPLTHNRYEQHFEYMFVFSKGKPDTFNGQREPAVHAGERQTLATNSATSSEARSRHGRNDKPEWRSRETRLMGNVWNFPGGMGLTTKDKYAFEHPAMFPEELARRHILSWSNPGDVVFDPFAGSGTTLKQSILLGRETLGFEINADYAKIAERRIQDALRQPTLFDHSELETKPIQEKLIK